MRTALGHGAGFDSPGFRAVHKVSPLLGEAVERLLVGRGLTLLEVYERGHELEEVYQLAEQMMTWDERTILWRFQHLKTVERIIGGNVIGTQGTPVEVLGSASTSASFRRSGSCATRSRAARLWAPTGTAADALPAARRHQDLKQGSRA